MYKRTQWWSCWSPMWPTGLCYTNATLTFRFIKWHSFKLWTITYVQIPAKISTVLYPCMKYVRTIITKGVQLVDDAHERLLPEIFWQRGTISTTGKPLCGKKQKKTPCGNKKAQSLQNHDNTIIVRYDTRSSIVQALIATLIRGEFYFYRKMLEQKG